MAVLMNYDLAMLEIPSFETSPGRFCGPLFFHSSSGDPRQTGTKLNMLFRGGYHTRGRSSRNVYFRLQTH